MDDQAKLKRMLRILMMLSSGIRYTIDDLAEKIDITPRTVRRYLDTFENAGFIIQNRDGYRWIEKLDKPFADLHELLYFNEEEAYILTQAIHSIHENNTLKQNLVKKLYSLYKVSPVADMVLHKKNSAIVHNLTEAIRQKKRILLRSYHSAHGNIIRDRLVEPVKFTPDFISFWAFDPEARKNKLFKTARVGQAVITDKDWSFETDHKISEVDVFRISTDEKIGVKLRLNLRAYNLLMEEYPLSARFLRTEGDNSWIFDGWVCSFEGVGRFVCGLIDDVEIIEPSELYNFVNKKLKNFINKSRN